MSELGAGFWLALVGFVWGVANTVYLRLGSGRADLERKIEQVEAESRKAGEECRADARASEKQISQDLNGLGQRVSRVETRLDQMPTHEFLAAIHGDMHEKMNRIAAMMDELRGEMKASAETRMLERDLLRSIHTKIMNQNQ